MDTKRIITTSLLTILLLIGSVSISYAQDMAYKLYPTENIYTVIKLNTRNGKVYQVQIGMNKNSSKAELTVNDIALVTPNEEKDGRFELQKTGNMYNFVMLDRINGRLWQVQWNPSPDGRFITPIY